jgi:type VI protein secretion system component Hcp
MKFRIHRQWRWLVALGAILVPGIVAGAFSVPHQFEAGTPIRASEMNENFDALSAKLDAIGKPAAPVQVGMFTLEGVLADVPIYGFAQDLQTPPAAKPKFSDVVVRRLVDDSSPQLNLLLNQSKAIPSATITLGKLGITLDNVRLTNVAVSGQGPGAPQEALSLSYTAIEWTWNEPGQPTKSLSWDLAKSTGGGNPPPAFSYAYFPPGVAADPAYVPIESYEHNVAVCAGCKPNHGPVTLKKGVGPETLGELAGELSPKGGLTMDLSWFADEATVSNAVELEDITINQLALSTNSSGVLQQTVGFGYVQIAWTAGKSTATWNVLKGTP